MDQLHHFMTHDHRRCDALFVAAEQAVADGAWVQAYAVFVQFQHAMLQHFLAEESSLFPAFEEKTGMSTGPTQVMLREHVQMRELMEEARASLLAKDADDYSGTAETLLIMMQQHNMKEENVLYPMCDQMLSDQVATLLPQLQQQLHDKAQ